MRSRWLDKFFFLRIYGPRRSSQKRTNLAPRVSHLTDLLDLAPGDGKMRDPGNEVEKDSRPISDVLTEQAWSIRDLLYGFREIFLAGHNG